MTHTQANISRGTTNKVQKHICLSVAKSNFATSIRWTLNHLFTQTHTHTHKTASDWYDIEMNRHECVHEKSQTEPKPCRIVYKHTTRNDDRVGRCRVLMILRSYYFSW